MTTRKSRSTTREASTDIYFPESSPLSDQYIDDQQTEHINADVLESPPASTEPADEALVKELTKAESSLIDAQVRIENEPPRSNELTFMHSVMCQLGLPRSKVDGLQFERTSGSAGIYIQAGKIWDGKKFLQQPVPYGTFPRMVLAYLNTQALRQKSPEVDVGSSASEFLRRIGKDSSGGKNGSYTRFRQQLMALSACNITIGLTTETSAITYDGKPIRKFEAWLPNSESKGTVWPKTITFSDEYYTALKAHAVPLDLRALEALMSSALAMDLYVMLAERLHRIKGRPVFLYWNHLREQFGQEYKGPNADKNFKKSFLPALKRVKMVYPDADVKQVNGGILMSSSPPPVPYKE